VEEDSDNKVRITYLVLDVLKPHRPTIVELSRYLAERINTITTVNTTILEIDQDTESIKMEIYGENLEVDMIKSVLREYGASVHSVDEVTVEK